MSILKSIFKFLLVSLLMSSVAVSNQFKSIDSEKSKFLEMHSVYGYSFKYRSCWIVTGETDDIKTSEEVQIYPGPECPKEEIHSRGVSVSKFNNSALSNEDWAKLDEKNSTHRLIYKKNIVVNGTSAVLWETLKDESEKLINNPSQDNFGWSVKLFCGKFSLAFGYSDYLDLKGRNAARLNHEPPAILKEFIDGFTCDSKK